MKRLTLVRHAKSSWKQPGVPDFERPLNGRGRRDAPRMAARLLELGEPPQRLITSPAVRALETARIFAEALGVPEHEIVHQPELYDASVGTLVAAVQGLDDALSHVAVFAHNPGVSELVRWLTGSSVPELPTCALARIVLDVDRWRDVAPACGRLERLETPKEVSGRV